MTGKEKQLIAEDLNNAIHKRLLKASDSIIKKGLTTGDHVHHEGGSVSSNLIEQVDNGKNVIRIISSEDEKFFSIFVDNSYVKTFYEHAHGSQGMSDAQDLIRGLADALNIDVKYEYDTDQE